MSIFIFWTLFEYFPFTHLHACNHAVSGHHFFLLKPTSLKLIEPRCLSVFANLTSTLESRCHSRLNKVKSWCLFVCVQRSLLSSTFPLIRMGWGGWGGQSHCLEPTTHVALHRKQSWVAVVPTTPPPVPRSHHCSGGRLLLPQVPVRP